MLGYRSKLKLELCSSNDKHSVRFRFTDIDFDFVIAGLSESFDEQDVRLPPPAILSTTRSVVVAAARWRLSHGSWT